MEGEIKDQLARVFIELKKARQKEPNHRLRDLLGELDSLIHKIRNELTVELCRKEVDL